MLETVSTPTIARVILRIARGTGSLISATWVYWGFCFFNLVNPLVTIVLGFTGWTIVRTAAALQESRPQSSRG
jgi:hypothetical protein